MIEAAVVNYRIDKYCMRDKSSMKCLQKSDGKEHQGRLRSNMRLHYNNVITYCGVSIVQECRNATHDGFEPYIVLRVSLEIQGALRTGHSEEPGHGYSTEKMSAPDSNTYAAEIVKPTSKGPIVSVTTE